MALALCCFGITYLAFLSVGTSCGWFVVNGLYNLIANEPEIGRGGPIYDLALTPSSHSKPKKVT